MVERWTYEEEAKWFDEADLRTGRRTEVGPPDTSRPLSALAVPISGADIDRLVVAAEQRGIGPTDLARQFILDGLATQDET